MDNTYALHGAEVGDMSQTGHLLELIGSFPASLNIQYEHASVSLVVASTCVAKRVAVSSRFMFGSKIINILSE